MSIKITKIECYKLTLPRDTPYLGKLGEKDIITNNGYFIRHSNSSIYSLTDNSLLVKVYADNGAYGWGECVTVVAPQVAESIIEQIIEPLVVGKDPMNVIGIYEDLYNAMNVRGFFGGFYLDAIAAVDIAVWDLKGKILNVPIYSLLGSSRNLKIKAYVSGLPLPTRVERIELAKQWIDQGYDAIKVPVIVDKEHIVDEIEALRQAIGKDNKILIDMHWRYTALEAIKIINKIDVFDLYVAEAPVAPEDIDGQAEVVRGVQTNVAIGEELRSVFEYLPRFSHRCMNVIQPEIGRTGITNFWHICQLAKAFHVLVMPHASIGIGVFQAASLQVSAALSHCVYHEYQHSIFDKNIKYLRGNMRCENGYFFVPEGPGLGVEPREEALEKYTI